MGNLTPAELRANRIALVHETFDYYYEPDGTPKPGMRSLSPLGACSYNGVNGTQCAAARLNPTAPWEEGPLGAGKNSYYAIEGAKYHHVYSGDDVETVEFVRAIQRIHDAEPHSIYYRNQLIKKLEAPNAQ